MNTNEAIVTTATGTPAWTQVKDYADIIRKANEDFDFGFPQCMIDLLSYDLEGHKHLDFFTPSSVRIWPIGNLRENWTKLFSWMCSRLLEVGIELNSCINVHDLTFFATKRDEKTYENIRGTVTDRNLIPRDKYHYHTNRIVLTPCRMNLATSYKNLSPNAQMINMYWAGIEIVILLALNPQMFKCLDGKILPHLCANGVRVSEEFIPVFHYNDHNEATVSIHFVNSRKGFDRRIKSIDPEWSGFDWNNTSVVTCT